MWMMMNIVVQFSHTSQSFYRLFKQKLVESDFCIVSGKEFQNDIPRYNG